jgi:MFS transporter, FSR family, fosmidomycin resistance protein
MSAPAKGRSGNRLKWIGGLAAVFLAIEFLDELTYGAFNAAWPVIRNDLNLTYGEIGLLIGLPLVLGNLVEPILGLLGDLGYRKRLILLGAAGFTAATLLTGAAGAFLPLLLAGILLSPSSGTFVSLSQATLMDLDPARREPSMARWTLAGSIGVVAGPLLLTAAMALGGSWRILFFVFAAGSTLLGLMLLRRRFPIHPSSDRPKTFREAAAGLAAAFRRREVLRWLSLLAVSDLMLDVLLGFLALYFTDVAAVSPALAGAAVAVWTGAGLLSDALIIPLLERVNGIRYLRISAALMIPVYAGFLLAPWLGVKLALLAGMGLLNAGWYAIPQARVYAALPGKSGTAMAANSLFGVLAGCIPAVLGWVAQTAGLAPTMWLLMIGPVGLLLWLPRISPGAKPSPSADSR